ncbi:hypothetical protein EPA93_01230 [Ktedonosporobacter rubrisoli]|uniref:Transcription regulator PadR C-terminal domain-containing protein n=1 Tax=Ktedonosporobacter rubrisoli TaxID=2509675 RepID=A0A4P6JI12_KTERU|nr:hypothetical protein [Ktedonosporobacter rubrisoli]QBD74684.1 hypothetical protein EPA93_01230 [Ktedonosporobacter rubrisoli]
MKKIPEMYTNVSLMALWQETIHAHFVVALAPHEVESELRAWRTFARDFGALLAGQMDQARNLEENKWLMLDHLATLLKAELRWLDTTIALLPDLGIQRRPISGIEKDQKPQGKEDTSCG